MKNFVNRSEKSTHPSGVTGKGRSNRRLGARIASVALGAVCFLSAITSPETFAAGSAAVSQLKYIQVLVQLTGDESLFSPSSKPSAYVEWAVGKGMEPVAGWKATAQVSSDILAQTLVQLFDLNPRKFGGDFYRILERDGIVIGRAKSITSEYLAALIDNPTFALKTREVAGTQTSPHKPDDDDKHGGGGGKDNDHVPKPRPGKPPPSPGHHHRDGKPGPRS